MLFCIIDSNGQNTPEITKNGQTIHKTRRRTYSNTRSFSIEKSICFHLPTVGHVRLCLHAVIIYLSVITDII